ncbi:AraC family transcriptional regulator [Agromyces salentinus]|uniref:Helix-turn-helix domain-containing protein n=1 Tax=Agromyces salentinus TaxID=269421 RepID=A0ABN2MK41_9MICO|nr:helix-turn-helix domain-containing protein [Agromyces salentinus]
MPEHTSARPAPPATSAAPVAPVAPATRYPIRPDERSGMLHPRNVERFAAAWIDPHPSVAAVVDRYWHVTWNLPEGEHIDQRIIDHPAVTLTIEAGDVPAPLLVTGVQRGAWRRRITGSGSVFAIRLRPAGLEVVSDLAVRSVADAATPVIPTLDARVHRLLATVEPEADAAARAAAADDAIATLLVERPLDAEQELANAVLVELAERVHERTGTTLGAGLGASDRAVQRALARTVGHGPKWVTRRVRLQEVARVLSTDASVQIADLAARLGYADQAHLGNDFRGVVGLTPGAYQRSVRTAMAGVGGSSSS